MHVPGAVGLRVEVGLRAAYEAIFSSEWGEEEHARMPRGRAHVARLRARPDAGAAELATLREMALRNPTLRLFLDRCVIGSDAGHV